MPDETATIVDDREVAALLTRAKAHLVQAIDLFQSLIARIEAGEDVAHGDAERSARALLAAVQTFLSIRIKLDDHRPHGAGSGADLDAARDQVGGLLDRLRSAGEAG